MDVEVKPESEKKKPRPQPTVMSYYAARIAEKFTRQNLISQLKTLAWVIPLTLLIWIYAEREEDIPAGNVSIAITVKSSDPNRTVTLLRPQERVIVCDLEGPHSDLDRFREMLSPSSPITIEIDSSMPLGEHEIPTLQAIQSNPRFRNAGISVDKASPETLRVDVDQLEHVDVPVEPPADVQNLQKATFDPPTIRITGPHQILERLKSENGHLAVLANIDSLPSLAIPGPHAPQPVSLLPMDPNGEVTYSTNTVQATLFVKAADEQYVIHDLPVLLLATGSVLDQYSITWDRVLPLVTVVGPPDKIDQLRPGGDAHPFAALYITGDNVTNPGPTPLRIVDLPDGVRLAPGQNPQMNFTVTKR